MADLSDAQRKRAEARQRRRKQPEPENGEADADGAAPEQDGSQEDSHHAVRQAAKVAAAAGAAGAVAAAARALANHQDDGDDEDDQQAPAPDEQEPALDEQEPEQPQPEAGRKEPEPQPDDRDDQPVDGASTSDARRALDRGRSQLEDLLGRPVESVSSLERTHDGWVLALEVVEVKRIPETTDVLASYELELDDDLDLRRYQQVRRYHRAQAERDRSESA